MRRESDTAFYKKRVRNSMITWTILECPKLVQCQWPSTGGFTFRNHANCPLLITQLGPPRACNGRIRVKPIKLWSGKLQARDHETSFVFSVYKLTLFWQATTWIKGSYWTCARLRKSLTTKLQKKFLRSSPVFLLVQLKLLKYFRNYHCWSTKQANKRMIPNKIPPGHSKREITQR